MAGLVGGHMDAIQGRSRVYVPSGERPVGNPATPWGHIRQDTIVLMFYQHAIKIPLSKVPALNS